MPKRSAGLLLYRVRDGVVVEVLIGHPGGPFWARRDDGAVTFRDDDGEASLAENGL